MSSCAVLALLIICTVYPFFVHSLQCPKCEELQCEPANCRQDQVLREKAFCGCCDKCVTLVGEGHSCGSLFSGSFVANECKSGLVCDISGRDRVFLTCQKQSPNTTD